MKNIINICYCIDSSFLPLTVKSINNIRGFFKSKDHTLKFYIISNEDIPDIPKSVVFIKNETVPVSLVQLRSFIPEMLGVDRVLYIDADTIISTCISKLWEINITGFPIGAVQHCYFKTFTDAAKFYRFSISLYNTDRYFNSGVLLIDCIKWNDNKLTEKACDAFDLYRHTSQWKNDEPGLNMAIQNNWYRLDDLWNYCPRGKYKKAYITHYYGVKIPEKPVHSMFEQ